MCLFYARNVLNLNNKLRTKNIGNIAVTDVECFVDYKSAKIEHTFANFFPLER
jgi:ribosome-binding factor A